MSSETLFRRTFLACAGLLGAFACAGARSPDSAPSGPRSSVSQNVLSSDYAGSAACAKCHSEIARRFLRSPMHRMTRELQKADIRAPFDGHEIQLGGDRARAVSVEGRDYIRVESQSKGDHWYRVSKVIGGRHREDFVGFEVDGTGPRERQRSVEMVLPMTWVFRTAEWRYKGYSVQLPERSRIMAGPVWKRTCIFCHNTVPYFSTVFDDLGGVDKPSYQGHVPSNLLPQSRRLAFAVTDPDALRAAAVDELDRLEAPVSSSDVPTEIEPLMRLLIRWTYKRFDAKHLVEVGIGCESCHGGSAEHALDPKRLPSFTPVSPLFSVKTDKGALEGAVAQNHACARCHTVLFSAYPFTWEGGQRRNQPGGSTINSGEARDFLLGGCSQKLTCTTCHDPHAPDEPQKLAELGTVAGNRVCVTCHSKYSSDESLRRHSHHDPRRAGGACIGCHMPKKNLGLDYDTTRYHRIGSPTDRERVLQDRPIECALCHRKASVAALVGDMERWWNKRYDRAELRKLYGEDLDQPVLVATLARGKSHEQTVAIAELGRTGDSREARRIVDSLGAEYPITRYFAREALARLVGKRPPLDMSRPGAELMRAGREWLDAQAVGKPPTAKN